MNRRTVELRQLMTALVGDVSYQHRLRDDFRRRRVHPSTEAVVWAYAIGRPAEKIELAARVATEAKIADERAIYERLTSAQLAELAAASEAVRDRAVAMLMSNRGDKGMPVAASVEVPGDADDAEAKMPSVYGDR